MHIVIPDFELNVLGPGHFNLIIVPYSEIWLDTLLLNE